MLPKVFTRDTEISIGVLLAPPPVQLLDLASVDLFYILSKEYMDAIELLPRPLKDLAINTVKISYITDLEDPNVSTYKGVTAAARNGQTERSTQTKDPAVANASLSLAPLTSHASLNIIDLDSPDVQAGKLTILVIPGPDPSSTPSQRSKDFIKAHASSGNTDVIVICTGIYPACYSGICDGKRVSGPRGLLSDLSKKFRLVKAFEDKRWAQDYLVPSPNEARAKAEAEVELDGKTRRAELWSSAGITNGHDCVAAYIRAHFDPELGEVALRMADVGDRPREYDAGRVADGMWWMSTILTAFFKAFWRKS